MKEWGRVFSLAGQTVYRRWRRGSVSIMQCGASGQVSSKGSSAREQVAWGLVRGAAHALRGARELAGLGLGGRRPRHPCPWPPPSSHPPPPPSCHLPCPCFLPAPRCCPPSPCPRAWPSRWLPTTAACPSCLQAGGGREVCVWVCVARRDGPSTGGSLQHAAAASMVVGCCRKHCALQAQHMPGRCACPRARLAGGGVRTRRVGVHDAVAVDALQPLLRPAQPRALVLAEAQAHVVTAALQGVGGSMGGWGPGAKGEKVQDDC